MLHSFGSCVGSDRGGDPRGRRRPKSAPLGCLPPPPELLCRDDPEAVDLASLYAEQEAVSLEEGEGPLDVDLDDEYDLMRDRDPGVGGASSRGADPLAGG